MKAAPQTPRATTQHIGSVVSKVLRRMRPKGPLVMIQRDWSGLVGRELAAHSKPVSLRRGRLIVHVNRPGESFTLNYRRPQLLARLQKAAKTRVEELVIRAGEI